MLCPIEILWKLFRYAEIFTSIALQCNVRCESWNTARENFIALDENSSGRSARFLCNALYNWKLYWTIRNVKQLNKAQKLQVRLIFLCYTWKCSNGKHIVVGYNRTLAALQRCVVISASNYALHPLHVIMHSNCKETVIIT